MIHQTKANSLRKIAFRLKICENKCYAREITFSQRTRGKEGDGRQGRRKEVVGKGGGEKKRRRKRKCSFI